MANGEVRTVSAWCPQAIALKGKPCKLQVCVGEPHQFRDNGKLAWFSSGATLIPSVNLGRSSPAQSDGAHPSWATTLFALVMPCLCPGRKQSSGLAPSRTNLLPANDLRWEIGHVGAVMIPTVSEALKILSCSQSAFNPSTC